jgi:hypothetical protein
MIEERKAVSPTTPTTPTRANAAAIACTLFLSEEEAA